ncbi:MAG: hypothetical protein QNL62_04900 [Gammaproteobacteria bacterium]|nr:hypothetical protein [Gammaproteobacteria bacterium]
MNQAMEINTIDDFSVLTEPVFYYGLKKSSKVPDSLLPIRVLNFFEYSLKQNPGDLTCHMQRIQFARVMKNNDELFAALCDLFIILGSQGFPLRRRLLAYGKKILDKKQVELLVTGHLTGDMTSLPHNCFFKKTSVDLINLCSPPKSTTQGVEEVLHTIDSYIENSQFDSALEYMSLHLEQDPENEALTEKLINLYKALNYKQEFQLAYKKFANHLMTSRYWDDAEPYFKAIN